MNASVGVSPVFFRYSVAHVEELENHLLLLNVSNKSKIQIYLHIQEFPDETTHYYPLGDVPRDALS